MGQNLYKNWLLVSKIICGIWKTSDKQWKAQKIEIQWTFLQLKHIQRIYLTLLSTTMKIHQIPYVIFETINHDTTCQYFFSSKLHTFDRNIPSRCTFSDFPLLELKSTKLCHFASKKWVFLQSLDHSSVSREMTLLHFFSWNFICH